MRRCIYICLTHGACAVALVLGACAQPEQRVQIGMDKQAVIATLGPPKETYDLPNGGKRLMWPTQPMGTTTTAVDLDASGNTTSVRQVLQEQEFYRAEVGKWTRDDVLTAFGRPFETSHFKRTERDVWSYRYMESNIYHMIFNFYFDPQGVLRQTQKQPDPQFDPSLRNRF
jgi:outer membrane protein assembly factor BamE (lipoprotein component of BamABCDE complex)